MFEVTFLSLVCTGYVTKASMFILMYLQEAAKRVGEELIKASIDLKINEISSYDRNGNARGERMQAFEIAIKQHGFLP